ncbi:MULTISPECIES: hypothetical protein [Pseudomonas]|nr:MULTISPECIES: hypothetical protein [Pseudomonas]
MTTKQPDWEAMNEPTGPVKLTVTFTVVMIARVILQPKLNK